MKPSVNRSLTTLFIKQSLIALIFTVVTLSSSAQVLEEVVVTAQKRTQNLGDIAASVTALSPEDLEKRNVVNASDIASAVTNLNVNMPYGEGSPPVFTLRGVTSNDYSFNQSRPVALFFDEGIRGLNVFESTPLFDLERVEVLKGAQGTLYGKNATGGAVNVISKTPDFETEGYLTAGYGNFDRFNIKGAAQTALLDDVLAARFAFTYIKDDGFVKNTFPGGGDQNDADLWAGRISLYYEPSDNFNATLKIYNAESGGASYGVLAGNVDTAITGGVDRAGLDFHTNNSNRPNGSKQFDTFGINLLMNWDVTDDLTITSSTVYDEGDAVDFADDDGLPIHIDENDFGSRDVSQFAQEIRLASNYDGPFNFLAGVFYSEDEGDNFTVLRLGRDLPFDYGGFGIGLGLYLENGFTQERDSFAAFLRGEYDISDTVTLTAGIRYSDDEVEVSDYNAFFAAVSPGTDYGPLAGTIIPSITGFGTKQSSDNTSFEAGIDWAATDDILAYFTFKQGYRQGAINAQAFFAAAEITTAAPEEVDAFEIGLKSTLWDGRLQANFSAFYYDYTNQQFLDVATGGLQVLRNAEASEVTGFEADLLLAATDRVQLNLGVGILDPEYKKVSLAGVDLSGNQLIGASELNVTTGIDAKLFEFSKGFVNLHFDAAYTSEYFANAQNQTNLATDGYWLANARLTFDSADDRYSVSLWSTNLFDKEYNQFGFDTASFFLGFDYLMRARPRYFGADFTYRF